MYNDYVISQHEHDDWFNHALIDSSASYFIFMHEDRPIGFISFTSMSHLHGRCFWAFYSGVIDVPRGTGSAMEFFALDHAFLTLKIRKLCCEVFAFNAAVVKLHEKFGFTQEGRFIAHYLKNGQYEDIVCLAKFGATWINERETIKSRVFGRG